MPKFSNNNIFSIFSKNLKKHLTKYFLCDKINNVQNWIAELCKGSTADSDSVCWGSNPYSAAKENRPSSDGLFSFFWQPNSRFEPQCRKARGSHTLTEDRQIRLLGAGGYLRKMRIPLCRCQQKSLICLVDKLGFFEWCLPSANDARLRPMMTATPNDVCLTARWANIASLRNEVEQHHFERSEKHHIAVGDVSLKTYKAYALIYLR